MDSKKLFTVLVATVLIVVIVFSLSVIAAPALQSDLNVTIQNKGGGGQDVPVIVNDDDPVDVNVTGELDINDASPINVGGTVKINGTVPVSLDGTIPVEVQNTVPVNVQGIVPVTGKVDVSGWLHTTKSGSATLNVSPMTTREITVETKGFKQITFVFSTNRDHITYKEYYEIGDESFYLGVISFKNVKNGLEYEIAETFDVISESMVVKVGNGNVAGNPPVTVTVNYFMTT